MNDNLKGFFIILEDNALFNKPTIIKDDRDDVVIDTILQEAETNNRNKRNYSHKALYNGLITNPLVQEKIKHKAFVGEAG